MMFRGMRAVLVSCVVMIGLFEAAPVARADDEPGTPIVTRTTVAAPAQYAGGRTRLDVSVTADGAGIPAAEVVVERRVGRVWRPLANAVTGADGHLKLLVELSRVAADNAFRARYAGDATYAASTSAATLVRLVPRRTRLALFAPKAVVDERTVRFAVFWRTRSGLSVPGEVRIQMRSGRKWVTRQTVATSARGRATWRYRVRKDSRWRAVAPANAWAARAVSSVHVIDNRPPGVPVVLPRKAPRPRVKVPAQPRATRAGAAAVVTPIPDVMWKQMVGRTWHSGCPLGRSGLRLIRVNYWAYDGYRRRGELVVNARVASNVAAAFREIYDRGFPIRSMYRVDRFGWSKKLRGGNDYASMAAGNTSAFNCRSVVNSPGVLSPHSYGTAVDVNTWENPYRSRTGLVPNSWWQYHPIHRISWRSSSHPMVRLMHRHGLRWTYGNGDSQHFDATAGSARTRVAPRCVGACD